MADITTRRYVPYRWACIYCGITEKQMQEYVDQDVVSLVIDGWNGWILELGSVCCLARKLYWQKRWTGDDNLTSLVEEPIEYE